MTDQQAGSPNAREVQFWNSAHSGHGRTNTKLLTGCLLV